MDEPLEQLADEATAGLKDDPELRLDVRAELRSHLEERARAFAGEGHDEAASAELAAKAFGPPAEIGAALLAANARRMKLRALVRLFARAVLVPAAVIVGVVIGLAGLSRSLDLAHGFSQVIGEPGGAPATNLPAIKLPFFRSSQDRLDSYRRAPIIEALRGRNSRAWALAHPSSPDARIAFAHWATSAARDAGSRQELAELTAQMQDGMRLDPGNGLYNLLLAAAYLRVAVEYHEVHSYVDERTRQRHEQGTYTLHDRELLEQGIREYRAGLAKPYVNAYHGEGIRRMLGALPAPRRSEDYLDRFALLAFELFPELAQYRDLAPRVPFCAEVLLREGRVAEAEALLESWEPLSRRLAEHATSLIDILVIRAIDGSIGDGAERVYTAAGMPDRAVSTQARIAAFVKPVDDYRAAIHAGSPRMHEIVRRSGILAALLPAAPARDLARVDLAPARRLEYALAEQFAVNVILLALAALLLIGLAFQLAYRVALWRAPQQALLVLPTRAALLRVAGLAVVLPIVAYFALTRLLPGIGRGYALWAATPAFLTEIGLLAAVLLVLRVMLAKRHLARRCRALGVAVPTGLFHATMARSLAPIYALTIILLGLLALPYLSAEERSWLHRDRLVFTQPAGELGFTALEARIVHDLKQQMLGDGAAERTGGQSPAADEAR